MTQREQKSKNKSSAATNFFSLQKRVHIKQIGVGGAVNRAAVNIEGALWVRKRENAHVGNRAKIDEIVKAIDDSLENAHNNQPLREANAEIHEYIDRPSAHTSLSIFARALALKNRSL